MVIKKVRDGEKVTVHANSEKTIAGSRHYIHAADVAEALMFLFSYDITSLKSDSTGAKCQKFNIVGKDEIDNLELAQFIADVQKKDLNYEMVDFHSSRPGHDLRYALDGEKMKLMGWEPNSAYDMLERTINWSLEKMIDGFSYKKISYLLVSKFFIISHENKLKYFISITAFFSFVFSQISLDDINNINNAQLDLIKDQLKTPQEVSNIDTEDIQTTFPIL